jgi:spore maturation protein CgeB
MISSLKDKTVLLSCRSSICPLDFYPKNIIPALKKIFKEVIIFDTKINYFRHGKELMNKKFLEVVKDNKPDYAFFDLGYDEFYLETFEKLREISPKTITLTLFGDDNWRYDDFSRYYSLFFDFIIVSEKDVSYYKKDKLFNTFFLGGANIEVFKPSDIEKIYDVSFIGGPINDRPDFIRFLLENKVNIKLFGEGWSKYPEFKEIWKGVPNLEDYPKVINQSKINLNFSKTFINVKKNTQLKGRIFEILACDSFLLTEYFEGQNLYLDYSDEISFKTKEQLLEKIKYYLKNEKKRKVLTKALYKKMIKDYVWEKQLMDIFKKISKQEKNLLHKPLPKINKNLIYLSKEDLNQDIDKLNKKIKNCDYIFFKQGSPEISAHRDFFQAYSLEKSKKEISCCDYYVSSKSLGDYMLFMAKRAFNFLNKEDFSKLSDINQIAVTKDYFISNIEKFKGFFNKEPIDIIDETNTIFVSIPLISLNNLKTINYDSMKDAFRMKFLDDLFSLIYQKKVIFSPFLYKLMIHGILKDRIIFRHLVSSLTDSWNWEKLKTNF